LAQKKKGLRGQAFSCLLSAGGMSPPAGFDVGSERTDLGAADANTEEEGEEGHFFGSHFCAVPRKSFR
jgi:hypothetical protein